MTRASNTHQRRRQIAQALMNLMATEGYDGATITAIAREAELTSGLVHYHFRNKRRILLFMLDMILEEHHNSMTAALEHAGERPWDQLDALIDVHLAVGADTDPRTTAAWVGLGAEALRNEEVREAYSSALLMIAEQFREVLSFGRRLGAFAFDDLDTVIAAFMAIIQGYFNVAMTTRQLIPRGSAAGVTRQIARGLLSPQERNTASPHPSPKEPQ